MGDLLDAEDELDVNLDIEVPGVVLDLGFSNVSFIRAVFMSIAVRSNNYHPR